MGVAVAVALAVGVAVAVRVGVAVPVPTLPSVDVGVTVGAGCRFAITNRRTGSDSLPQEETERTSISYVFPLEGLPRV